MATWNDIRECVARFPGTTERATWGRWAAWRVREALIVWERPLLASDREELGAAAPDEAEPIVAFRVEDEMTKQALLAEDSELFLTTSHFEHYPCVLARLDRLDRERLAELVEDAWRARAPRRMVRELDAAG
jgi:hypothetical protein